MSKHFREKILNKGKKQQITFRRTAIAIAIASLTNLSSLPAYAADDQALAELQKALEQLKTENDNLKKQLASKPAGSTDNSTNTAATTEDKAEPQENTAATQEPSALDAIIVKFKKKPALEKIKDVPTSVSIVSGEELESLNATNTTEVLRRIGNVNFNYGNSRTGSLTLRGVTTGSSDQIDPSIGTLLDGVSIAYTPLVNGYIFTDIDTIDATRGPQGTQGGKASNIGRLTFTTKAPTFTPEANFSQTFGDWNTLRSSAVLGGPVVDNLLAWRGTFYREQADGPTSKKFENQFPDLDGRDSYQNVDRTFGRIQFLLTPTENFSAKLSVEHQPRGSEFVNGNTVRHPEPRTFTDGTARSAASVDVAYNKYVNRQWFNNSPTTWNPATDYFKDPTNVDNNGGIITGSKGATINLDWNVAGHNLKSITGYRSHWFSAANDEGTPYDITKSGGYITAYSQISQELRVSSAPDKNSLVDYLGGVYFIETDNDSNSRTRYGNDAGAFQANDTIYNALYASGTGQALLKDSLNLAYKNTQTIVKNQSTALFGQADWHITEPLTLTTGYRISKEDRKTAQGIFLADKGVGADLTNAFGNGTTLATLPDPTTPEATAAADRLASKYFGTGTTYAGLTAPQRTQLKQATVVRNATLQPNSLYNIKNADRTWNDNINSANVSLTNKFNEDLTVYGTLQYGEKAGIAQINTAGESNLIDKEKTKGYELGIRTNLFEKTLTVNADVFLNDIKDFQSTVGVVDPVATAAFQASNPGVPLADSIQFQSVVGNVPGVRVKGIEVDANYSGFDHFNIRLAAAYNDARYSKDIFLARPSEENTTGTNPRFSNAKGETLTFAPKFSANLGVDYNLPVFGNWVFHTNANYSYSASQLRSRSSYDKLDAYGILDLGVGIGRQDKLFDLNFIAKNALNKEYNVEGFSSYTPSLPRWVGVVFSSKL